MRNKNIKLAVLTFIVVLFGSAVLYSKVYAPEEINLINDYKQTVLSENDKKLEEIRNRENIKRRQELIVQEVFLMEEKDRISIEKDEAIKQYDIQTEEIEKLLEEIRAEEISF